MYEKAVGKKIRVLFPNPKCTISIARGHLAKQRLWNEGAVMVSSTNWIYVHMATKILSTYDSLNY